LLEFIFVFCIVWSFGACLKPSSRKKFETSLRKTSGRHLPNGSLFDFFFDFSYTKSWQPWKPSEYTPPADGKFSKILVPTVDTVRFSYMLKLNIDTYIKYPVMFIGDSGTAKSVIISNFLVSLP
jgi:dynein heavy chain